jgi:hypothetical protein
MTKIPKEQKINNEKSENNSHHFDFGQDCRYYILRPVESWNFWLRQSLGLEKSC